MGVGKARELCLKMAAVLDIREREGSTGVASVCTIVEILDEKNERRRRKIEPFPGLFSYPLGETG